ncbi:MAG TPA: hypothetical protein VKF59_11835 [Candidatus Dormibacteraeota bacterium]|nr:hypothetical protein [Candidatus Dormibacteraeota bacterium]
MTDPVLGWRVWKLRSGRLGSWAVDYCWEPGENRATCLTPGRRACSASPGQHCQCGFWAVWSPRRCAARVCSAAEPPWHVMGLIAGWGTVALHDGEGFRAEWAAMKCLFTDRPWSSSIPGWLARWWRRKTGRTDESDPGTLQDRRHWHALEGVAERYAVPLVSLETAASLGLLSELGVPSDQIEEARNLGAGSWPRNGW